MVLVDLPETGTAFAIDGSLIYSPRHSNVDELTALNTTCIKVNAYYRFIHT